jgi:glutathione peroxidase-family protein
MRLVDYRGKVLLLVNVASKCGHTKQYADLQALYNKYRRQGLVVIGFPANNFGSQEPGTNQQIREFCSTRFGVTFPPRRRFPSRVPILTLSTNFSRPAHPTPSSRGT